MRFKVAFFIDQNALGSALATLQRFAIDDLHLAPEIKEPVISRPRNPAPRNPVKRLRKRNNILIRIVEFCQKHPEEITRADLIKHIKAHGYQSISLNSALDKLFKTGILERIRLGRYKLVSSPVLIDQIATPLASAYVPRDGTLNGLLVKLVSDASGEITKQEIIKQVTKGGVHNPNSISSALGQLVDRGILERVREGMYKKPEK